LSKEFVNLKLSKKTPKAILYMRNVDGDKGADGKFINYFPIARGIKTDRYTLAISIDKKTKKLKEVLFFDDLKDPYQMNNLSVEKNKELFKSLCNQMPALLKQANDPWYKEKILSDIIPY
jgi:hypothetical protein